MLVVTSSSIDCFRSCHKKYYYQYELCIKPRRTSWPLTDGTALHMALEHYYGSPLALDPTHDHNELVGAILRLLDAFYDGLRDELDGDGNVGQHKALARGMFKGYSMIYSPNEFEWIRPEIQFTKIFPNNFTPAGQVTLAGKTDALIRKGGNHVLLETKTTSDNSMSRYVDGLLLADQPCVYLTGFTDYSPIGVLYNIVRKARLRQMTCESDQAFYGRIEQAYVNDAKNDREYYHREMVYRTPDELAQWHKEFLMVTADMCYYYPYKNPKRCTDWSGCEFKKLCEGCEIQEEDFVKKTAIHEELQGGKSDETDLGVSEMRQ